MVDSVHTCFLLLSLRGVGDIANDGTIKINNACSSISESQAFLLSVFNKSKNPPDFPTIPNSSFLISH